MWRSGESGFPSRVLVERIVLNVGLESGVLSGTLFSMMVRHR
jgi:hypothetical protein